MNRSFGGQCFQVQKGKICQNVSKYAKQEKTTEKYIQNKIKKHNIHQHSTDDGGQAVGE